jgi:hypothetical protein
MGARPPSRCRHARQLAIRPASALLSILFMLSGSAASAQEAAPEAAPGILERAGITGSVRAGYWSSTRELDSDAHVGSGMIWLKASRPISERVSFLVEGWAAIRGSFDDPRTAVEVREAFIELRVGRLDLRVGRQIFAWGRADGVNPTDNLTGEDLTLLVPEEDDRRLGATAVRGSYYFGDLSVTGLWLPEFRGHRFPLPPPPPGLTLRYDVSRWPGNQWGARVEQTGRAIDWSVSFFRGFDLTPDLGVDEAAASGDAVVVASHHRVDVVGADMAANAGRFGFRAEAAFVNTADASRRDPYVKNPFVFVVAGADRTFREYLNLNMQYLLRVVIDHRAPAIGSPTIERDVALQQATLSSQQRRVQHGISFRVAYKWLRETLEADCAAASFFAPGGVTLRPRLVYAISDHWRAVAGGELFRGESASLFGLLRANSTAYLEARWSF